MTNWLFTVWLQRGGIGWTSMGDVCLGSADEIVTTEEVGGQVRDQWAAYVPEQQPQTQPPGGRTVVNLPTYFDSGQPAKMPQNTVPILDFEIQLTARGEWTWRFELGATKTFDVPGSHHDDPPPRAVQHTYTTTGDRTVTLTTNWWGSFSVGGYGPYDIGTPATQGPYEIPLTVVEAGSVIIN
jgi:hypothetical protein